MSKLFKWVGIFVSIPGSLLGAGLGFIYAGLPSAPPASDRKVEATPESVERGRYLANHVTGCIDCHSTRDFSRYSGPVVPGTEGKGGQRFGRDFGLPGTVHAPNLTPKGLGDQSDGEIQRAMTTGVAKDGRALFPLMPWQDFSHLCQSDADAIVAYLRTLSPKNGSVPPPDLDFPVNLLIRTLPKAAEPWSCPDSKRDPVAAGKYLVQLGGCSHCHTQRQENNEPRPGMYLAGGARLPLPSGGAVHAANITPDTETGIGRWSRQDFIARFAAYRDPKAAPRVERGQPNTFMPWTLYAGMSDDDLGAIYDYLRTVPPVKNVSGGFVP